jgi:hypothetical protein
MVITTLVPLLPGVTVTVADGAKRHCIPVGRGAPGGSASEQASDTAPGNNESGGFGATFSWYAPVVWPAVIVWVSPGVDSTVKDGTIESTYVTVWLAVASSAPNTML